MASLSAAAVVALSAALVLLAEPSLSAPQFQTGERGGQRGRPQSRRGQNTDIRYSTSWFTSDPDDGAFGNSDAHDAIQFPASTGLSRRPVQYDKFSKPNGLFSNWAAGDDTWLGSDNGGPSHSNNGFGSASDRVDATNHGNVGYFGNGVGNARRPGVDYGGGGPGSNWAQNSHHHNNNWSKRPGGSSYGSSMWGRPSNTNNNPTGGNNGLPSDFGQNPWQNGGGNGQSNNWQPGSNDNNFAHNPWLNGALNGQGNNNNRPANNNNRPGNNWNGNGNNNNNNRPGNNWNGNGNNNNNRPGNNWNGNGNNNRPGNNWNGNGNNNNNNRPGNAAQVNPGQRPPDPNPSSILGVRPPSTPRPDCGCQSTAEYNPVCGTDGATYENRSRLQCARVCANSSLRQKHRGACTTPPPTK